MFSSNNHPCQEFRSLELGSPYDRYFRDIRILNEYAIKQDETEGSDDDSVKAASDEFRNLISILNRKPNICFLGRFDSGKSTLANVLMHTNTLPAKIAPHTAIPTIVRHIADRPTGMSHEVYLLNNYLQINDWNNKAKIEKHLIASGGTDLLATKTHKSDRSKHPKAMVAFVFLDSPFLTTCNIIDFPGYGHDEHDNEKAQRFESLADAIFYLSPIIGFLDAQDIFRIGMIITRLPDYEAQSPEYPTLGNLFIVATHADPDGYDISDIQTVFDSGSARLQRELGGFALKEKSTRIGKPVFEEDIKKRFHVFWKRKEEVCASFSGELKTFLAISLPAAWRTRADVEIDRFSKKALTAIAGKIDAFKRRLDELDQLEELYKKYQATEPQRKHELQEKVRRIAALMREYATESEEQFQTKFNQLTTEARIEEMIRQRYDSKQEAEGYALGYLYELLKSELSTTLEPKTKHIVSETETFVREYRDQQELDGATVLVGVTADDMASFLAGAGAVGTLGALASLGLTYGGAWLAINTTGTLATIGAGAANVGLAFASGLSYALSALTGPIGVGLVAAIALFAIFRGPWQKRMAKELRKKINEGNTLEKLLNGINKYWKDTETAFLAGVDEMEKQRVKSMDELRAQIDDPIKGEEEVRRILAVLGNAHRFFSDVPWISPKQEVVST